MQPTSQRIATGFWALLLAGALPALAHAASNSTILYSFTGGADGAQPNEVITDSAGNIYGTTQYGGAGTCALSAGGACGTVFKITPGGQLTVLATFTGPNGAIPYGPVTLAGNTLYGTTSQGGSSNNGVIFSVNTDGSNYQVLHQFSGRDGYEPGGTVLVGPRAIYGVAAVGGPTGLGVLYQLNEGGTYVILHAFRKPEGANPSDIRFMPDGAILGSAPFGGTGCGTHAGCGTIFSYNLKSATFDTLYQFTGHKDGSGPYLGTIDSQGNVYGATAEGPENTTGSLFELSPGANGYTLTTLADLSAATGYNPGGGPALLPTGQLLEGAFDSVILYDPAVAHDGSLVISETSSPEFGGPAAIGPDGTAFINGMQGGPQFQGQIWSIAPAAP